MTQLERNAQTQDAQSAVHEFLEWCDGEGIELCKLGADNRHWPLMDGRERIVAKSVGIDTSALECERRELLKGLASGA